MVATKQFPKGVQLFEAPGCNAVVETLAKGGRALAIERLCKGSPRTRAVFRRMFESNRPQDRELSEALGLPHIRAALYETTGEQRGLLGASSDQLMQFALQPGRPRRSLTETKPQATRRRDPGSKPLLARSSDELLAFAMGGL